MLITYDYYDNLLSSISKYIGFYILYSFKKYKIKKYKKYHTTYAKFLLHFCIIKVHVELLNIY